MPPTNRICRGLALPFPQMPSNRLERPRCAPGFHCLTIGHRIVPCGAQLGDLHLSKPQRLPTRLTIPTCRFRSRCDAPESGRTANPASVVNPFSARSRGIGLSQRTRLRTPPYVARTSPVYRRCPAISISHLDIVGWRDWQCPTLHPCRSRLCITVRKCAPTRHGPGTVSCEADGG